MHIYTEHTNVYICVRRHAQLSCDFPASLSGYWWGFKLGVVRIVPLPLFMPRPSLISSSYIIHPHTGPCCSDCFLVRMLLWQRKLLVLPQLVKVQALEYKIFALTDSKMVHQLSINSSLSCLGLWLLLYAFVHHRNCRIGNCPLQFPSNVCDWLLFISSEFSAVAEEGDIDLGDLGSGKKSP